MVYPELLFCHRPVGCSWFIWCPLELFLLCCTLGCVKEGKPGVDASEVDALNLLGPCLVLLQEMTSP